jgi:hypothetical protein
MVSDLADDKRLRSLIDLTVPNAPLVLVLSEIGHHINGVTTYGTLHVYKMAASVKRLRAEKTYIRCA